MHHAHLNGAEAASAGEDERRFCRPALVGYGQDERCSLSRRVGQAPRDGSGVYSSGDAPGATGIVNGGSDASALA
jgi:hypothetical protein